MSIFKKRKAAKSSTTAAAPAMQEKPVASQSNRTIVVNIWGAGTGIEENWVQSDMNPQRPMPRTENMAFENMPMKNCANPAAWYFPEYSDETDAEMVYRFPSNLAELLALAYCEGAVYGTQYISFWYNRAIGTICATAWGLQSYRDLSSRVWQVTVEMDVVQTFLPYIITLPNGTPAMDTRLCNAGFVSNLIGGNNFRTRVGYGLPANEADDVYDLLVDHIALFISSAAKGCFKHELQFKADRHFNEYAKTYKEKLESIIAASDKIIAHVATKKFHGFDSNASEWTEAQNLFDEFVKTTTKLDMTGNVFSQLRYEEHNCGVKLNLSKLVETINLAGFCYEKLRGLFDLLRS